MVIYHGRKIKKNTFCLFMERSSFGGVKPGKSRFGAIHHQFHQGPLLKIVESCSIYFLLGV